MHVLALTKYDVQAASTRQRFAQYVPYLAAHGVEVELSPLLSNNYLNALNAGHRAARSAICQGYLRRLQMLLTRRDYDLLWVQYELFPYLPGLAERLSGWTGKPIICDYDDAIFHGYDNHRRSLVRRLLGNKLEPLLTRASAVICGNSYLKSYAEGYCPNSVIVPTVVDTSVYLPRSARAEPDRPLVVGWLGSPTTWQNVEPLLPAIMPAIRTRGATLRVIGAGSRLSAVDGIEPVDWSEASEVSELQGMDVGIMPLLDGPFERGKCGYKLIQYMACGVPVVASPVGVNAKIVVENGNGFLASDPSAWAAALERLLDDAALRRRMGFEGRCIAVERYSLAVHQPRVLDILRSATGSTVGAGRGGAV
jgi:glycosyltransferase involved in cell wall biosynthesis